MSEEIMLGLGYPLIMLYNCLLSTRLSKKSWENEEI